MPEPTLTLQEINDLHQFFFRFLRAGNIFEARAHLARIGDPRTRFSKGHRGTLAARNATESTARSVSAATTRRRKRQKWI